MRSNDGGKDRSLLFRLFSDSQKAGNDSGETEPIAETADEIVNYTATEFEDESAPLEERLKQLSTDSFDAAAYYRQVMTEEEQAQQAAYQPAEAELDAEGNPIPVDAKLLVEVTPDGMEAFMVVIPAQFGGEEITEEGVQAALAAAGVNAGLLHDVLDNLPYDPPSGGGKVLVAQGSPKQDGIDGEIVELFPRVQETAPQHNADGTVDFKQLNITREVAKDTPICELIPATAGLDGITVKGEVLRAKPGKNKSFLRGNNTAVSEDGLHLVSTVDGNLSFVSDRFHVECAFVVEGSVDNNTGNISFGGDVLIKGDVREGYEIRCGGSLRVIGTVEGASVYSENGNIIMEGGFNGMKRGEAVSKKGSITSKFLQNCTVYAKDKITTESIINSVVDCDASITVTKGKGVVVGGRITALHTIEANIIGSDANTPTSITVGLSPTILAEKQELEKNMRELEDSKEQMKKNLIYLERCAKMGPLNPKNQTLMETCNKQKVLNLVREGKYTKQLQQIQNIIEEAAVGSWVKAKTVFPSTKITIQSSSYMTKMEYSRAIFRKDDGEVKAGTY